MSDDELRPYFPLPKVLEGLFALVERLYDLRFEMVRDGPRAGRAERRRGRTTVAGSLGTDAPVCPSQPE